MKVSLNHTLRIPLHYSTHKVFISHVKPSQADVLYSSVLLELSACLLVRVLLPLLLQLVTQSQSHFTTDSQSVCLSWCRAPSGAHDQIFILV
jgi:hypothetical protein